MRFSAAVLPGISPIPSNTTRVGIPSVCDSTVLTERSVVIINKSVLTILEEVDRTSSIGT